MTEKECLKALDCLYDDDVFDKEVWGFVMEGDNLSCADVERAIKYYRDKIYNLIKEHFDNPPLELNDLEIEKPYWDNEEKEWCFFVTLHKDIGTGVKISISVVPMMCAFQYKENRFYRKEVK